VHEHPPGLAVFYANRPDATTRTAFAFRFGKIRGKWCYSFSVMTDGKDPGDIANLLADLREEHRDLDHAIARLAEDAATDQLQLTRLKKRKLKIKDWIAYLESKLIPDLDA